MLIFCSGKFRYSFPNPARFLIHGNSLVLSGNTPLDSLFLENQLQQIKNLNEMTVQVLTATTNKKASELESMVRGQTILTPEEAKQ